MGDRKKHTPIRINHIGLRLEYTYLCDGCGREVSGYIRKAVYGKVLCWSCRDKYIREKARLKRMNDGKKELIRNACTEYRDNVVALLELSGFMTPQVKKVMDEELERYGE